MEQFINAINEKLVTCEPLCDYIPEVFSFVPPQTQAPYLLLTLFDHMPKGTGGYFKGTLVLYNRCHGQIERLKLLALLTHMMSQELAVGDQTFMAKLLTTDYVLGDDNLTQKTTLTYHIKYQRGEDNVTG